jgi:N-acetylmuramoyl-L-alanine amidase
MKSVRIIPYVLVFSLLLLPARLFAQNAVVAPAGARAVAVAAVDLARTPAEVSPRLLTLDETITALGAAADGTPAGFRWDPFLRGGVFSLGDHHGAFAAAHTAGETGFLMLDNREVFAVPMPYLERGNLVFPDAFVRIAGEVFSRTFEEDASRFRIAAIIIDAGHGGKDSGAVGNVTINGRQQRVVEKEITLAASRQLRDRLSGAYSDKRVLMTREGDTFPSLEERTVIANSVPLKDNEAIIYISIHANASVNKNARGYEVWYLSPDYRRDVLDKNVSENYGEAISRIFGTMLEEEFTTESIIIARSILKAFDQAMERSMPSRGLKAEEWFVVRNSRMPAVLVELGFVTNPEDAVIMTGDAGLRKLTDALYNGITEFVAFFESSGGLTAAQ